MMERTGTEKAQATAKARSAVIETTELLENILLFLPPRQLLCAQRVSPTWRACIKGSVKAQRALFLQPVTGDTIHWQTEPPDDDPFYGAGQWVLDSSPEEQISPTINPVARELFLENFDNQRPLLHHGVTSPAHGPEHNQYYDGGILSGPRSTHHYHALHHGSASWRDMLVMQPPCRRLEVYCGNTDGEPERLIINSQRGLTFQVIFDHLMAHLKDHPDCPDDHGVACWDYFGLLTKDVSAVEEVKDATELLSILADVHTKSHASLCSSYAGGDENKTKDEDGSEDGTDDDQDGDGDAS